MSEKLPHEEPVDTTEASEKDFSELKRSLRILKAGSADTKSSEVHFKDKETNAWGVYNSTIYSFEIEFLDFVPEGFDAFLKEKYKERVGELVGMEIGGPGRKLFRGFSDGLFKKTVGVSLSDLRSDEEKVEDSSRNHEILEADVFLRKPNSHVRPEVKDFSFTDIEKWCEQNGKPDFIVERMIGGTDMIHHGSIFFAFVGRWYEILNKEGVMFVETPNYNYHNALNKDPISPDDPIFKKLSEKSGVVEFKMSRIVGHYGRRGAFMIKKSANAPEKWRDLLAS